MAPEEGNEFFGHLNQPATPRRTRRPSSLENERPNPEDFRDVPDPFDDVVGGDHPLAPAGSAAPPQPQPQKPVKGPGLSPGLPVIHDRPASREVPRSGVVLTPSGVRRVDDQPKAPPKSQVRKVQSTPEDAEDFHEESRQKNDEEDMNWEEYAAGDFPAMAAEEFGVKVGKTQSGRMVPVGIRADLTDEAIKNQSIKGKGKGGRAPKPAPEPSAAPKTFLGKVRDSFRLRKVDDDDDGGATKGGFAKSGSMPKKKGKKKTPLGMAASVFTEVLKILALVLLLRAYVVQVSQVQGPSMEGTLVQGDRLVVERVTPLLANNRDKWWIGWLPEFVSPTLKRGDIIVIRSPEDPGSELVKRLIALPGDSIKFEDGKLWLKPKGAASFEQVKEDYLGAEDLKNDDGTYRSYGFGDLGSHISEGDEILVPANRIFVMGDNRAHSNDSRRWLEIDVKRSDEGINRLWVHTGSVEGRVIFRIYPFDRVWPPVK
ncbi:MAG: signal peptidase I [Planctomycetes bacterium]|nr:signal peptidase I [Planctomycetota bacterium]MCW8134178.1 signal peptidase I [Planctomycetota bacterium]